ncbi:Ku DNA-binding complex, Ku70 subunit [Coprinellus micaceus]|uniref:ATP-dependent DNA helicase II subunit 1 n=1 Tax=Coprinellus micaceus TaxID=71717 RepID=A0A4Y7TBP1_COPMI|nr:Ku DNA-binding complex, Ku70 subunit [Coprinellus micaceus]
MAPYDEWNKIEEEDDEELQDTSLYEGKRDVILFAIDCSESMLQQYEHPEYENLQTCHLYMALEAAMQIEKRKIIAGPRDSVGIMLFNTTRKSEGGGYASEIKQGTYLYQSISLLSAPKVQEIIRLLEDTRENPSELESQFPPTEKRVPMGDVFTSCNWILRDGAPKTATKRVFLITDEDNPHPGSGQLVTSARTTLIDLTQAGVTVEPFFISTEIKPFNTSKFYSTVLLPTNLDVDDEGEDGSILPESISLTRIEDLLAQMRFHEVPKRAMFTSTLKLGEGFIIGVKGYNLVTEQKKGSYQYFVDLGDRMEAAKSRTMYVDELRDEEVDRTKIVYGASGGASAAATTEDDGAGEENSVAVRKVKPGQRPFYTPEEITSFRTMGLETGIKLLGFKDRSELRFEDNVKHSLFLYPDEMAFSGSKRTFSALLKSMVDKRKIGLALALTRRNASPMFCYLLPQEEKVDPDSGWTIDPPGIHVIPIPFADDIRAAPIEQAHQATGDLIKAAQKLVSKLTIRNGTYPPDSYPNPALAFHNAQLEAAAFREEFTPEEFVDLTEPNSKAIHKKAGELMKEWKKALVEDPASDVVDTAVAGTKRKADVSVSEAEFRSYWESGGLNKYKVDQLKDFLKSKSQPVSGKKADLVERVSQWFQTH